MNYIQIQGTLRTMSDSFFISSELSGRLTPESLSQSNRILKPNICIDNNSYEVTSVIASDDSYNLTIIVNNKFTLEKEIEIEEGKIFGICMKNKKASFRKITYDNSRQKYICEIIIDETEFWS